MVTRTAERSGLGLAISRQFMLMRGGELILESRVGQGTRAIARFPKGRAASVLLPDAANQDILLAEKARAG